jgi:hypothetical protein
MFSSTCDKGDAVEFMGYAVSMLWIISALATRFLRRHGKEK